MKQLESLTLHPVALSHMPKNLFLGNAGTHNYFMCLLCVEVGFCKFTDISVHD